MKKFLIGVIILAALAFITNPDESKHKEAVKKQLLHIENQEGIGGAIGNSIGNFLVNNSVKRKNHYLYSETVISVLGEEKTVGYGAFTLVMINEDALKNNN
jgi:hypothetical protein